MGWIRKRARGIAIATVLTISLTELRQRPHGSLSATAKRPSVVAVVRNLTALHEAGLPHLPHLEHENSAETKGAVMSPLAAPPGTGGLRATPKVPVSVLIPVFNEGLS